MPKPSSTTPAVQPPVETAPEPGDTDPAGATHRSRSAWINAALAHVPHVARRYLGCGLPYDELLVARTPAGPQDSAEQRDPVRHVRLLVATLGHKERQVVALRFGLAGEDPMTLREIGRRLGISRERVRQLEGRALIQLRGSL